MHRCKAWPRQGAPVQAPGLHPRNGPVQAFGLHPHNEPVQAFGLHPHGAPVQAFGLQPRRPAAPQWPKFDTIFAMIANSGNGNYGMGLQWCELDGRPSKKELVTMRALDKFNP